MGRRQFSREFKLEAVRLVTVEGHSVSQVARDLGIRPDRGATLAAATPGGRQRGVPRGR